MGTGCMLRGSFVILALCAVLIGLLVGCEPAAKKSCSCDKWRDLESKETLITLRIYDRAMEGVILKVSCDTLEFMSNEFGGSKARVLCDDVVMIVTP